MGNIKLKEKYNITQIAKTHMNDVIIIDEKYVVKTYNDSHNVSAVVDFAESRVDSPLYDLVTTCFFLLKDSKGHAEFFLKTYYDTLDNRLTARLNEDKLCFDSIVLSAFVFELYLMLKSNKKQEVKEAYEMLCLISCSNKKLLPTNNGRSFLLFL